MGSGEGGSFDFWETVFSKFFMNNGEYAFISQKERTLLCLVSFGRN